MKMMWSSGIIKNLHHQVGADMQKTIPMALINTNYDGEYVDGVKFDVAAIFEYIIEKFSLSEKAKNGTVNIAITIDAAKLEGKLCHVTFGFKIVDVDAVDPNTWKKVLRNMQSEQWCFPVMTIITKCNKITYKKYFDYIFDFSTRWERMDGVQKMAPSGIPFLFLSPKIWSHTSYALVSVVPARDRVLCIFVTYAVVPVMMLQSPKSDSMWSFNDEWAQKIDVKFAELIPRIFTTLNARQKRWLDVASNLSKILDTLKKQEEFTDDEIDMLDNDIHSMSKVWIGMFGREGMTNYLLSAYQCSRNILSSKMGEFVSILKPRMGVPEQANREPLLSSYKC
jgi:hypothetical protein